MVYNYYKCKSYENAKNIFLDLLKDKEELPIYLYGKGGCGKSYLINEHRDILDKRNINHEVYNKLCSAKGDIACITDLDFVDMKQKCHIIDMNSCGRVFCDESSK